ncbi:acyl-CoA desaturase [Microlunatus elymi]|uniref:Acyl-CoA desaturase n=1 Tax=Microlunatus elymi TaxID=2596828 RepID=A0A516Q571_9ACTN|nr:acyl-CoA desaturase [Microlunatus elymi]QDP98586.1 acyl-CoA desaturase [Microlunatus elymi]
MTVQAARPARVDRAQDRYTGSYTQLSAAVKESGLLQRRYGYYWTKISLTVVALAGVVAGMVLLGDSWLQLLLAAVLAVILTQFALLGHDAAHRQIFRTSWANEWASLGLGNLLGGFSLGWWQHKHSSHHANPNKAGSDPDVAPGVLAFTPYARAERHGLGRYLADRQAWFYFPLLMLEGLNLHVASMRRVVSRTPMKRRRWELALLLIRHLGYLTGLLLIMPPGTAAAFLGVQLASYGLYLGGAFTPNHIGMPTVPPNLKIDFLRRQVLMSRNVSGGWLVHFLLGGLDFQIEHHLFPSMPRPNLRKLQPLVRQVCAENKITYTEKSLPAAYATVLRYLNKVGLAARDPFGCPLAAQMRGAGPDLLDRQTARPTR